MRSICAILVLLFAIVTPATSCATTDSARVVYRMPTMGGGVWWIDVWQNSGYRIQVHKISGLHRLIDPVNVLVDVGSFEECQLELAKELEAPTGDRPVNANLSLPTLGGKQFWGDELYGRGWRIQRNVITSHYRLIDSEDKRRAWGTYEQCHQEYLRLIDGKAPGGEKPLVVLLHGIFRSPQSFSNLTDRLRKEGYEVCGVAYPSTRASIPAHARQLNRLLDRLEGVGSIYFVCHSMGGLVARAALDQRRDPRVKGIVTMGTPHEGAIEADLLKDWYPYKVIFGKPGQQLISGSQAFVSTLGLTPCPVGCIAGGRSDDSGYSPLVPGDDDGVVGVSSAFYDEAVDTLIVPSMHSLIMSQQKAIDATVLFLKEGRLNR